MYEQYWGLSEKPFENTPDPRFLFRTDESSEVFVRLLYALKGNRGAALLSGPSGCGKTLLVRALLQEMGSEGIEVALLTQPCADGAEFLSEVLFQLGEEEVEGGRKQAVRRLQELLYKNYEGGKETVIVIDEAQLLAEEEIFAEMRLLLNYQLNDAFLVTLMLVGQPPLAERIRAYTSLDQSISTRAVVRRLSADESQQYVAHRLAVAGRQEPIFAAEAVAAAHEYAEGVPRKLNNICDIALLIGFSRKLEHIDGPWMHQLICTERGDGA